MIFLDNVCINGRTIERYKLDCKNSDEIMILYLTSAINSYSSMVKWMSFDDGISLLEGGYDEHVSTVDQFNSSVDSIFSHNIKNIHLSVDVPCGELIVNVMTVFSLNTGVISIAYNSTPEFLSDGFISKLDEIISDVIAAKDKEEADRKESEAIKESAVRKTMNEEYELLAKEFILNMFDIKMQSFFPFISREDFNNVRFETVMSSVSSEILSSRDVFEEHRLGRLILSLIDEYTEHHNSGLGLNSLSREEIISLEDESEDSFVQLSLFDMVDDVNTKTNVLKDVVLNSIRDSMDPDLSADIKKNNNKKIITDAGVVFSDDGTSVIDLDVPKVIEKPVIDAVNEYLNSCDEMALDDESDIDIINNEDAAKNKEEYSSESDQENIDDIKNQQNELSDNDLVSYDNSEDDDDEICGEEI